MLGVLTDPATKYEIVLVYTGINALAEPSRRDFQDLSDEMNDASEVLFITTLNQTGLYTSLTAGLSGEPRPFSVRTIINSVNSVWRPNLVVGPTK